MEYCSGSDSLTFNVRAWAGHAFQKFWHAIIALEFAKVLTRWSFGVQQQRCERWTLREYDLDLSVLSNKFFRTWVGIEEEPAACGCGKAGAKRWRKDLEPWDQKNDENQFLDRDWLAWQKLCCDRDRKAGLHRSLDWEVGSNDTATMLGPPSLDWKIDSNDSYDVRTTSPAACVNQWRICISDHSCFELKNAAGSLRTIWFPVAVLLLSSCEYILSAGYGLIFCLCRSSVCCIVNDWVKGYAIFGII